VTLERQINLSNPADKISSTLVQRSLASGLSGGTAFSCLFAFGIFFGSILFNTSGKDIGTTSERHIGGDLSDLIQNAFMLFGHLMPLREG
jgi:hypothetical protein